MESVVYVFGEAVHPERRSESGIAGKGLFNHGDKLFSIGLGNLPAFDREVGQGACEFSQFDNGQLVVVAFRGLGFLFL